jgi:hypothetical protein
MDPEAFPRPTARAMRTRDPITVDGRLNEDAWYGAEPITQFI